MTDTKKIDRSESLTEPEKCAVLAFLRADWKLGQISEHLDLDIRAVDSFVSSRKQAKPLNENEKYTILAFHRAGWSPRTITKHLDLTYNAVYNFLRRCQFVQGTKQDDTETKPKRELNTDVYDHDQKPFKSERK